jgi:hypothetical protein
LLLWSHSSCRVTILSIWKCSHYFPLIIMYEKRSFAINFHL